MVPHETDTEVYRALTKEKTPTKEAFFLRPSEDSLSIALTDRKARGTLRCKGVAILSRSRIEAIQGLTVQTKRPHLQLKPDNPDQEMLEIMGLPNRSIKGQEAAADDFAADLLKTVLRYVSFEKAITLSRQEAGLEDDTPQGTTTG